MLPLAALLAVVLGAPPALTVALDRRRGGGGARPGARPGALAVRRAGAGAPLRRRRRARTRATRRTIEVTFATLHRLLGVGIGEHLGYLLTGLWTLLVAASILSTAVLPGWLGLIGLPIGVALLIGTLEFVGPNEQRRLAAGRDDRADRLHRLVALAHRAGAYSCSSEEALGFRKKKNHFGDNPYSRIRDQVRHQTARLARERARFVLRIGPKM